MIAKVGNPDTFSKTLKECDEMVYPKLFALIKIVSVLSVTF